jgi:hypothetical protein
MTPARFRDGMTFDEYVRYTGTPENLRREAGWWLGPKRHDFSGALRAWYEARALTQTQADAVRWLAAQPGGPAHVVVISEEWSSDCRRDVPILARLAEAGGLELRIFPRDGETLGRHPAAAPASSPNADIVNQFLNIKDGGTFQSVPVAAFFTRDFRHIYHYVEYPALYRKDRIAAAMQARARAQGGSDEEWWARFIKDWGALQASPFYALWASATVDEIISALHLRLLEAPR